MSPGRVIFGMSGENARVVGDDGGIFHRRLLGCQRRLGLGDPLLDGGVFAGFQVRELLLQLAAAGCCFDNGAFDPGRFAASICSACQISHCE